MDAEGRSSKSERLLGSGDERPYVPKGIALDVLKWEKCITGEGDILVIWEIE